MILETRWTAVLGLVSILVPAQPLRASDDLRIGVEWQQYATPEEAGWSSASLEVARDFAQSNLSAAVFVVYRGKVLVAWGDVTRRFKCHSVRKSLLSALYGIHVGEGRIDLQKTLAHLSINDLQPLTEVEKQARILDLLRSRSGVYHPAAKEPRSMSENRPARGSHPPGMHFWYNNWDFNTLCTIFEQETGTKIFEEFDKRIAGPLGMEDFWLRDTLYELEISKSLHPAYAFRMSARDLARFGQLYLRDGYWNGKRIVPKKWVKESTSAHTDLEPWRGYGLMWWVYPASERRDSTYPTLDRYSKFSATGTGGQWALVIPAAELVFVHRGDTDNKRRVGGPQCWKLAEMVVSAKIGEARANPKLVAVESLPFANALDPPKERTAIGVDPKIYDRFVGEYVIMPPIELIITKYQDRLFARVTGPDGGEAELFPESETEFFAKTDDVQVEFVKNEQGEVTGLKVSSGGETYPAKKK